MSKVIVLFLFALVIYGAVTVRYSFDSGGGAMNSARHYGSFTLGHALQGNTASDRFAASIGFNPLPSVTESVEEPQADIPLPKEAGLLVLSPLPFNSSLSISFKTDKPEKTSLTIYSSDGKKMYENLSSFKSGENAIVYDADKNPSGVYLVRLKIEDYCETQKAVLIK